MNNSIYDYSFVNAKGQEIKMSEFQGKVLLLVNTATECGLAPQFEELEKLHMQYKDEGLVVIGFPSNQFANQEPVEDGKMTEVCKANFGVTFMLSKKLNVNPPDQHPLFQFLTTNKKGFLGSRKIKWNFTKFLIDKKGNIIKRYSPTTVPTHFEPNIKKLLEQ